MVKGLYKFGGGKTEGSGLMIDQLGGKGAGLVELCDLGLNVPRGYIISTAKSLEFGKCDDELNVEWMIVEIIKNSQFQKVLKDLGGELVSVRSGAPVSMPGMMDTILNVGLTNKNIGAWCAKLGERAGLDCRRRLVEMLSSVALGVPRELFDEVRSEVLAKYKMVKDSEFNCVALWELLGRYDELLQAQGVEFPDTFEEQLAASIRAVFESWSNPRAVEYRKINSITEDLGTAVTIQVMVFGNLNDQSGAGVLFTRNPSTGEPVMTGEFLPRAQGEDVVAGTHTPYPLTWMWMDDSGSKWTEMYCQIEDLSKMLEAHYEDVMDIEFTVQDYELFVLQVRSAKRTARAAFRFAVDFDNTSLLTPQDYIATKRPIVVPGYDKKPIITGLPACSGLAVGRPVFSSMEAVMAEYPVILFAKQTTPDDIAGMNAAVGIVTAEGGITSHAAVVARAMNKPCVTGVTDMVVGTSSATIGNVTITGITKMSVDGDEGRIWNHEVPVYDGVDDENVRTVIGKLFEESGYMIRSGELKGKNTLLVVADLILRKDWKAGIDELVASVVEYGTEALILDLSCWWRDYDNSDGQIRVGLGCLGLGLDADLMSAIVLELCGRKELAGIRVVGATHEAVSGAMEAAGMIVVPEVKSIKDVLEAKGPVIISKAFIDEVIGGGETWENLVKILGAGGHFVDVMAPARSEAEVVFELLGAK